MDFRDCLVQNTETFELKRLVKFITDNFGGDGFVVMPVEISKYLDAVKAGAGQI